MRDGLFSSIQLRSGNFDIPGPLEIIFSRGAFLKKDHRLILAILDFGPISPKVRGIFSQLGEIAALRTTPTAAKPTHQKWAAPSITH